MSIAQAIMRHASKEDHQAADAIGEPSDAESGDDFTKAGKRKDKANHLAISGIGREI
jgi:hypothetical protein